MVLFTLTIRNLVKTMKEKIKSYIREHRDEIVKTVKKLVSIPSVKGVPTPEAPFGENCLKAIKYVEQLYLDEGYDTRLEENKHFVTGVTKGDDKLIGVFGHADVVPVTEGDWIYTKPFEPIEKDGFVIGRGARDNSSGVVGSLWAMKAIKEAGVNIKSRILLFAGSDEESGMSDVALYRDTCEMPDFSIIPDNGYPVCRGEKTILNFWADSNQAFEDIIDIKGGQAFNVVLDKAEVKIKNKEGLLEELEEIVKERQDASISKTDEVITLITKGLSTHAAAPAKSLNAFIAVIDILTLTSISEKDKSILKNIRPFISNPFLKDAGLFTTDSEFGDTTCVNGMLRVENSRLSLSFDCRFGLEIEESTLIDSIEKYLNGIDFNYRLQYGLAGYVIPEASPLVQAMLDAYVSNTGDIESKPYLSLGGTYARFLKNAVSTGSCTGKTQHPYLPEGHGNVHQPDEMLDIEGFLEGIEILAHMIIKADAILHSGC